MCAPRAVNRDALDDAVAWVVTECCGSHLERDARRFQAAVWRLDASQSSMWDVLEAHRALSCGLDRLDVTGPDRAELDEAVETLRKEFAAQLG